MTGINPPVVTVTQVNRVVGMLIKGDRRLANVAVRGEISNFTRHYKTGHLYFTLKDEQTQLKAVMFAGNAAKLEFDPDNGDKVVCWRRDHRVRAERSLSDQLLRNESGRRRGAGEGA